MSVITIPFGFEELPATEQSSIVPICLPAYDDDGRQIAWGWFLAVEQIQTPLRGLARTFLEDVWRVSELTESAVKTVWRTHGEDFGRSPSGRIYAQAKWVARDLRAGTFRERRGLNVELDELDRALSGRLLADPCDYDAKYGVDMDLAALGKRLREKGLEDIDQMLLMIRDGCTWKEIGIQMGRNPHVASRRFLRWMDKAARLLGLDV